MATGTAFSNYTEHALINHVLRNTALTSPAVVYAALFTAVTDGEAGTVTEVSGGTYARKAITFGAPAAGATDNTVAVDFGTATANWGTVTHVGIYDAATVGNLLMYGQLTSSKTINSGDSAKFNIGDLDVSLD